MENVNDRNAAEVIALVDKVKNLYMRWSKAHDYDYFTACVIYLLYGPGIQRQKDMADAFAIPKQTIHTIVARLEREGIVTLTPDAQDRRGKLVTLTEKGRAFAQQMHDPLMDCERRCMERMGSERASQLIDLLDSYALLLEHEMKKKVSKLP